MRPAGIALTVTSLLAIMLASVTSAAQDRSAIPALVPPQVAPLRPVVDDFYGTKVVDPYRYMENLGDPEVQSWFKSQNAYAREALAALPGRQNLLKRIQEPDASTGDVASIRRLPGDVYIYLKSLGGDDTPKLYIRKGLAGAERVLADPERINIAEANRQKGASVIDYFAPSDDLKYVALTLIPGGSELDTEIHIIEIQSGRDIGEVVPHCCVKSNPMWLPDSRSFVYGRWQTLAPGTAVTETRQKYRTYLHVLGTDPQTDRPVFGFGVVPSIAVDPTPYASIRIQAGAKYALGVIGTPIAQPNSAFYIAAVNEIGKSTVKWRKIADLSDDVADVSIHGDDLYLLTFKNAPRYKILRLDARQPDLAAATEILPSSEAVITDMAPAQDGLYVRLLDGGAGRLSRVSYDAEPRIERLARPFDGDASLFGTDPRLPGTLFLLNSWTKAYKIYEYDPATKRASDTKLQPVGPHDDLDNVEAEEVKVRSYDGTLVPLSIAHPKAMKLDGSNPALLEAYGAYGISRGPEFDPELLAWYERGGVYAVCHVRGGGEYGEDWHRAGKGPNKPNTWLDFIACAEYLIAKRYTSSAHLAGEGASAGGIPIGRSITERPDLFAAALIDFGGVDLLRIDTTANGGPNLAEFGSTKTEEGFKALYAMSPLQHIQEGTRYPAVFLTTGMNEPRVNPWQPGKMAARLQAATTSGKPILLYVDYEGGHGFSTGRQYQESLANAWSFLLWQFGDPDFQPHR